MFFFPTFIVCPQTSEGSVTVFPRESSIDHVTWSQSWRNLLWIWPCVPSLHDLSCSLQPLLLQISMARIMSYSFLKTELESTVYTLEKPKLLLELRGVPQPSAHLYQLGVFHRHARILGQREATGEKGPETRVIGSVGAYPKIVLGCYDSYGGGFDRAFCWERLDFYTMDCPAWEPTCKI